MRTVGMPLFIAFVIALAGCQAKEKKGKGTFPNFYSLSKEVSPNFGSSSLRLAARAGSGSMGMDFLASTEMPSTDQIDEDWSTVSSTSQNLIGQVLLDAGQTGPVKSMFVLLAQAQGTTEYINTEISDDQGRISKCTAIAEGTTVTAPFFNAATTKPFNEIDDSGKYNCYEPRENGFLAVGKHEISSAAADCTDPYEYYVMSTGGFRDQPNTENVDQRGSTTTGFSSQKFYYNGCSKDLKLYYTQGTLYSAGVEFTSRTELSGNVADHSFTIRIAYKDILSSTEGMFDTFVGSGNSKVASAGGDAVSFWIGYHDYGCSASATCASSTALGNYCVENAGTSNAYSVADSTATCAAHASAYESLTPLGIDDIPHAYFETSAESAGL